ncbi:MAG: hypothetical protein WA821_08505 [Anaerolineales bacterium]
MRSTLTSMLYLIKQLGQNPVSIVFLPFHGKSTAYNNEGARDWVLKADTQTINVWEKFTVILP